MRAATQSISDLMQRRGPIKDATGGHDWFQRFDSSSAVAECNACGLVFTHENFWKDEVPSCPGPKFRLMFVGGIEATEGRHRSDRP